ncbi:hypothetical protein NQ152_12475 [Microbacterium sp. zg.B48]|uniref:hypothetical protein n=1 Tax=Microbacterium sp. zg.B48 TaxID=2969408 RepID=UPI00214C989C|nr:hypothetical protein [Microbacterium sp. zg.B48]MCR2764318.1 hypothetical protein [Microbacterium sp. zg.B48]
MMDDTPASAGGGTGGEALREITFRTMSGRDTTLGPYEGDVGLVVNVASRCGLTPQYEVAADP